MMLIDGSLCIRTLHMLRAGDGFTCRHTDAQGPQTAHAQQQQQAAHSPRKRTPGRIAPAPGAPPQRPPPPAAAPPALPRWVSLMCCDTLVASHSKDHRPQHDPGTAGTKQIAPVQQRLLVPAAQLKLRPLRPVPRRPLAAARPRPPLPLLPAAAPAPRPAAALHPRRSPALVFGTCVATRGTCLQAAEGTNVSMDIKMVGS